MSSSAPSPSWSTSDNFTIVTVPLQQEQNNNNNNIKGAGCSVDFSVATTKSARFIIAPSNQQQYYALECVLDGPSSSSGFKRVIGAKKKFISKLESSSASSHIQQQQLLKHKDGMTSNKLRLSISFVEEDEDEIVLIELRPTEIENRETEKWVLSCQLPIDLILQQILNEKSFDIYFASKANCCDDDLDSFGESTSYLLWKVDQIGPAPLLQKQKSEEEEMKKSSPPSQPHQHGFFIQQQSLPHQTTMQQQQSQSGCFTRGVGAPQMYSIMTATNNGEGYTTVTENPYPNVFVQHHYHHHHYCGGDEHDSKKFKQHFNFTHFSGLPSRYPSSTSTTKHRHHRRGHHLHHQRQLFNSAHFAGLPSCYPGSVKAQTRVAVVGAAVASSPSTSQQQHFSPRDFQGMPNSLPSTSAVVPPQQQLEQNHFHPRSHMLSSLQQQHQHPHQTLEPAFYVDESNIVTATVVQQNNDNSDNQTKEEPASVVTGDEENNRGATSTNQEADHDDDGFDHVDESNENNNNDDDEYDDADENQRLI